MRAQISFKETCFEEVELYLFLKEKAKIMGNSAYMKILLKKEKDMEESKK